MMVSVVLQSSLVCCAEADAAKAESVSNLVCLLVNIYIKLLDL